MSTDIWQLFIKGFKGNTMVIDVHKDAQIKDIFRKLKDKTGIDKEEYVQLVYAGKMIDFVHHKDQYLNDLKLENHSNLYMVMRLPGGSENQKVLDADVELSDLPDMITCEDDKDNKRAKMPCGHAIGPESLTAYCRSLLSSGKYRFLCPWVDPNNANIHCNREWPYIIVRRLAVLTDSEKREFETKLSENYLRRSLGIQECPGCASFCQRKSSKDKRVVCLVCTHDNKMKKVDKLYEFCWYCLHVWKTSSTDKCGNDICSGKDPRIAILERAVLKEIVGVPNVPARRGCVSCGLIIEHVKACKHMTCVCGAEFCFICLKPKENGAWSCGTFNQACQAAPRQTELP